MTRKDFQLIASWFDALEPHDKTSPEWKEWRYLAWCFSINFEFNYPKFDIERFREACGIK